MVADGNDNDKSAVAGDAGYKLSDYDDDESSSGVNEDRKRREDVEGLKTRRGEDEDENDDDNNDDDLEDWQASRADFGFHSSGTALTSPRPNTTATTTTTPISSITKTPVKAEIQDRIFRLQEAYQKMTASVSASDLSNDKDLMLISQQVEEAIEKIETLKNVSDPSSSSHRQRVFSTSSIDTTDIPEGVVSRTRTAVEEKVVLPRSDDGDGDDQNHQDRQEEHQKVTPSATGESPVLRRLQESERRAKNLLRGIERRGSLRRKPSLRVSSKDGRSSSENSSNQSNDSSVSSKKSDRGKETLPADDRARATTTPTTNLREIHVPALETPSGHHAISMMDEIAASEQNKKEKSSNTSPEDGPIVKDGVPIWGREDELRRLETVFSHVGNSKEEDLDCSPHAWISGPAGIGKSALSDAFLSKLPEKNDVLVCRGSFGLNVHTSPHFSGIVECFNDLLIQLQSDNVKWITWKQRLRDATKEDFDVLSTVLPVLPSVLGIANGTKSSMTKNTFDPTGLYLFQHLKVAFKNVITALSRHKHIVFRLDGIQWASEDSIEIIQTLLESGNPNFFLLGCYENVDGAGMQALKRLMATTKVTNGPSENISLGKIDIASSKSMVQYQLYTLQPRATSDDFISQCFHTWFGKSKSFNPLLVREIITLMHESGSLFIKNGTWALNEDIEAPKGLLAAARQRLNGLSDAESTILSHAAALDMAEFDSSAVLAVLSTTDGVSFKQTSETVRAELDELTEKKLVASYNDTYFFCYELLRYASYANLGVTPDRHLTIGRELAEIRVVRSPDKSYRNESLQLSILHHFLEGWSAINDEDEKLMVKKLVAEAAENAMSKASFDRSIQIIERGMATFDEKNKWKVHYATTLKIHLTLASCHFFKRNYGIARSVSDIIITNAASPKDKVVAFELLVRTYLAAEQYDEAKICCLRALEEVWGEKLIEVDIEKLLARVRSLVQDTSDADILVLPAMTHRKNSSKMKFLLMLSESSGFVGHHKMQDLASLRMMELTMKFGSYQQGVTALALVLCGICLSRRHIHGEAYRYGHLARIIGDDHSENGHKAIVNFHCGIHHWRVPPRQSEDPIQDVCESALDNNHLDSLSFGIGSFLSVLLVSGLPLNSGKKLFKRFLTKRESYTLPNTSQAIFPYNMILEFMGEEKLPMNENLLDTRAKEYKVWFQIVTSVFFGDIDHAEHLSSTTKIKLEGVWVPYRAWIDGLIATHQARYLTGKEKSARTAKASKIIAILSTWVDNGMKHIAHMPKILQVELKLATEEDIGPQRACILFNSALDSAAEEGCVHHEALAHERAGHYFRSVGENKLAAIYLSQAYRLWQVWGARAKVIQLKKNVGNLLNAPSRNNTNLLHHNAFGSHNFSQHVQDPSGRLNRGPSSHGRRSMERQGSSRRAVSLERKSSHAISPRPTPARHNSSGALLMTSIHSNDASNFPKSGEPGQRRGVRPDVRRRIEEQNEEEDVEKEGSGRSKQSNGPEKADEPSEPVKPPKSFLRKMKRRGRSSDPLARAAKQEEEEEEDSKPMSFFQKIKNKRMRSVSPGEKRRRGRSSDPVPEVGTSRMRSRSPSKEKHRRGRSSERSQDDVDQGKILVKSKSFLQKIRRRVRSASRSLSRSLSPDGRRRSSSKERNTKEGHQGVQKDHGGSKNSQSSPLDGNTKRFSGSEVVADSSSIGDHKGRRSLLTRAFSWGNHGEKYAKPKEDNTPTDASFDFYIEGNSGSLSSISLEDLPRDRRGRKKSDHLARRKKSSDTKTISTDDSDKTPKKGSSKLSSVNLNRPARRSLSPTMKRRKKSKSFVDLRSPTTKKTVAKQNKKKKVSRDDTNASNKVVDDEDEAAATATDNTTTSTAVPNKARTKIKVKKRTSVVKVSS